MRQFWLHFRKTLRKELKDKSILILMMIIIKLNVGVSVVIIKLNVGVLVVIIKLNVGVSVVIIKLNVGVLVVLKKNLFKREYFCSNYSL